MRVDLRTSVLSLIIACVVQIVVVSVAYGRLKQMLEDINYRVIRIERWIDDGRK